MAYVYVHTFPNGKKYVGLTTKTPEDRWLNGRNYANNIYMTRAIKKYGWENIQHDIIAEGVTEEEAEEIEKKTIAELRSNNPKYGYNITGGGEKGKDVPKRTRDLISKKTREKIASGTKKRNPSERAIVAYDKSGNIVGRYQSESECSRDLGVTLSNVSQCCTGKYKTSKGYVLRYDGEPFDLYDCDIGTRATPVDMYTRTGEYVRSFKSITEVEESGIAKSRSVSSVCSGQRKATQGYVFRYSGDAFDKFDNKKAYFVKGVQMLNLSGEHEKDFTSVIDAAKEVNGDTSAISAVCKGKRKSAYGHKWKYCE